MPPTLSASEWLGAFTSNTPVHLITPTTHPARRPGPVARYKDYLPERNRAASRITPVKGGRSGHDPGRSLPGGTRGPEEVPRSPSKRECPT
ncbi:hypothetical protein ABT391_22485 [Streptomyces jumonjinensis]|uniref:Uncharacterized protein n=2 Tax=Streptomyces jumonjinensis TaxID=1945 RepID=A0A646KSL8_STRJU|nr:hypothetical protein [Streptomyces jumonjinensis]